MRIWEWVIIVAMHLRHERLEVLEVLDVLLVAQNRVAPHKVSPKTRAE